MLACLRNLRSLVFFVVVVSTSFAGVYWLSSTFQAIYQLLKEISDSKIGRQVLWKQKEIAVISPNNIRTKT